MSGTTRFAVLIAILVGCIQSGPTSIVALAKAPVPKPPPRPTTSLGQPLEEALDALKTAKARDFSASVGIFICVPSDEEEPRYEYHWFILRDNTCLCVLVRRENARGKPIVAGLELGEEGKGYSGKFRWSDEEEKHRHVKRLELP
jgi:hypothetical protein